MFLGYCYPVTNGWHSNSVNLPNENAIMVYIKLHHSIFQEIRITDEDDYMIIHVINHKAVTLLEPGKFLWLDLRDLSSEIKPHAHLDFKEGNN